MRSKLSMLNRNVYLTYHLLLDCKKEPQRRKPEERGEEERVVRECQRSAAAQRLSTRTCEAGPAAGPVDTRGAAE